MWIVGHVQSKPFGKTLRRRALTASACWIIVASGSSAMSMAVIGFCIALDVSHSQAAIPGCRVRRDLHVSKQHTIVLLVVKLEATTCADERAVAATNDKR